MTQAPRSSAGDDLREVFAAAGKHQQRFRFEVHFFVQHQLAQLFAERRAARFARAHQLSAALLDVVATKAMCVDLPAPSMPSKVMNLPMFLLSLTYR
jgi:hypothetical protein